MPNFVEQWEYPPDLSKPRADLSGLSLNELRAMPFEGLGRFKQAGRFPDGYSTTSLTFYAPRDPGVHAVIVWALLQVTQSLVVNMYGFTDEQVGALVQMATENHDVVVSLSLDESQYKSVEAERKMFERFRNDLMGNSIAIGRSIRGAISHDKLMVVDGLYLITGSTNLSASGQLLQDNQLTLSRDPMAAAEARAVADLDHDEMLKQMAAKAQNGGSSAGAARAASRGSASASGRGAGRDGRGNAHASRSPSTRRSAASKRRQTGAKA